ncbi:phage major capsid protein [Parabacteroides sp. AF48-14]|uniref:phage major capsid protein n=1 Tax=Parabacteroides sp. AF48-14 TaxID=2292052 RepID=UPI000EFDC31F|nr:phage major capsid protein [Parabacteroides sp. AF48-14]RHO68248.1 phage major capsid protein [Parabacteroides sp. AF48-14]
MRKYFKELFQNSMRGRKKRFNLACSLFAIAVLSFIAFVSFDANPLAAGVVSAGLGLMGFIDESTLDEEQKKFFKGLDDKLEELNVKFLKDELGKPEYLKQLEDLMNEFKDLNEKNLSDKIDKKDFADFKKEVCEQLVRIKGAMEKTPSGEFRLKSITEQIREQVKDFIVKDQSGREIVDLKSACKSSPGYKKQFNLVVKANTPITSTVTAASGVTLSPGVVFDSTISTPPMAESEIRQFANVATINARTLVYTELKDSTGDAEWVPEGGLKPSMTASIQEVVVNAGKVALTATLTEETLTDLPQLVAEVQAEIINKIGIEEENGILYGDGENGNIKGVFTDIPEYSLTSIKVDKPNNFDAIVAAFTQVVSVSKMNYVPNLVRMNPIDLANMKLTKDANGQYLFPPFTLQDGTLISGVQIRPSTSITEGEFVLGDFRYLNIRDYVGLSITFGWVNDDFQKNQVTMIGEKRLLAYIKSNYKTAFIKGTYATIKEAIDSSKIEA